MSLHSNQAVYKGSSVVLSAACRRERGDGHSHASGVMVTPFARCLTILSAFSPQEPWLGNKDLVVETGIPAPTISRMTRSLVALGYLRYSPTRRKYRLAAAVLSLGYAAIAHSGVKRLAQLEMQAFANANDTCLVLGTRERLEVILLEMCSREAASVDTRLHAGSRQHIASSPLGWAMLAVLPELERFYLLDNVERKTDRDWPQLQRRICEGISQVHDVGYCVSYGDPTTGSTILATPLVIQDHTPLVLACIDRTARMGRARVARELGPRLVATAQHLQEQVSITD